MRFIQGFLCCLLVAAAGPSVARAAANIIEPEPTSVFIEEIIVTGDLREREFNGLSASVSAIGERRIRQRSAKHLEDILAIAPNVHFAQGSSRARFYQIRGIGDRAQFSRPANSSVGLLIDDVDFSAAGTAATLLDVRQVEILRGPQGARYGAGALAGLINVQTHDPTVTSEGYLEQEIGNYGLFNVSAAYGGPLIPGRLLYRFAAQHHQNDGFIDNIHLDQNDTNKQDELTLRGKVRWFVFDALTVDWQTGYTDIDNGYDAFSLDNNSKTQSNQPGVDKQRSWQNGIRIQWATNAAKMLILANHSDSNIDYGYDEDWVFTGFHPDEYAGVDRYQRDRKNISGELRVISEPAGRLWDGRADWLVGLYTQHKEVSLNRRLVRSATELFDSQYETRQYAFYAELDVRLSGRWNLATGFRMESWHADYSDSANLDFSPGSVLWGGRVALEAQIDGGLLYASIGRGYKAGGFNIDGSLAADLRRFSSEKLYSFEIGAKRTLFDGRLAGHLAVFYMSRDDVQIESSIARLTASGAPEFIPFVGNAAEGDNFGIETEIRLQPAKGWAIDLSLGLLGTQYKGFINAAGQNFSGREQAHAPNWQYAISVARHLGQALHVIVEAQGRDNYYFSDSHNAKAKRANLLHLRLTYELAALNFSLWMRNVTDADVETRGFFFGNDPRIGYASRAYTQLAAPRTYGVTIRANFKP